jgi:Transposase DDE domain
MRWSLGWTGSRALGVPGLGTGRRRSTSTSSEREGFFKSVQCRNGTVIQHRAQSYPLSSEKVNFPFVEQVIKVERTVTVKKMGESTSGTRLYLTSLSPKQARAQELAGHSRGRWTVENNIHWVRGKEDACRARSGKIAANLALLRTTLIARIRASGRLSPTKAAEDFAFDYTQAIALIHHQRLTL